MSLILIADDDRTMRTLLSLAMEEEGFDVVEAANGQQAIAEFNRCQPDLVLLDGVMPIMDGFACCQYLTQMPLHQQVPVLMLTVLDDQASVKAAFDAGATDFITKPIQWPVLSQRVHRLLDTMSVQKESERVAKLMERYEHRTKHLTELMQKILLGENPQSLFLEALRGLKQHLHADRLLLIHRSQDQYFEVCAEKVSKTEALGLSPLDWSVDMLPLQQTDHPAFGVHYGQKLDPAIANDYDKLSIASTAILKAEEQLGIELWVQSQDSERIWSKRDQRQIESFWPCLKLLMQSNPSPTLAVTTGD